MANTTDPAGRVDPDRPAGAVPERLGELNLEAHLSDPRRRQDFVTPMFDLIAPRYDSFTRLFSFGMDARWKAELIGAMPAHLPHGSMVLDLACGTGDLAFAVARRLPHTRVLAIDASPEMIGHARRRHEALTHSNVEFRVGDMMHLDIPEATVHAIVAGYALRNVPDFRLALSGIARVLRTDGYLGLLDFYLPEPRLWRALFLAYLRASGNLTGWLWHREPVAYGYIASSISHFVTARAMRHEIESAGMDVDRVDTRLGGGIAIHVARRRRGQAV